MIISLVVFGVCFPAFIWVQSWVTRPIMPLYLVRHAPRANILYANFIAAIISNAIIFNM